MFYFENYYQIQHLKFVEIYALKNVMILTMNVQKTCVYILRSINIYHKYSSWALAFILQKNISEETVPLRKMNGVCRGQPITMKGLPLLDRVKRDCVNRSISVIVTVAGRFIPSIV